MGTTRTERFAERVAPWVLRRLEDYGFEVELRDYPLPFFDQKPPSVTKRNYPNEDVARLGRKLDERAGGFAMIAALHRGRGRPGGLASWAHRASSCYLLAAAKAWASLVVVTGCPSSAHTSAKATLWVFPLDGGWR